MGYIAKGTITLDAVNDAYTVSLTKPSCVIKAEFDGSNPQLEDAFTQIQITRGDRLIVFDCDKIEGDGQIETRITTENRTLYVVRITSVPTNSLEGSVVLRVRTDDGWETNVRFSYSIIRESTMLDWIKDWEGSKVKIGGTYIMTPKLFIGKKENFVDYVKDGVNPQKNIVSIPGLTGVYIGPDTNSVGLYGYSNSQEIFHLNDKGGMIGGWNITEAGLTSRSGFLQILGEGSIKASNRSGDVMWEISQDGSASFANGNVCFYANGNAEFNGRVISKEGQIGGWSISRNQLWNGHIGMDCNENAIGVTKNRSVEGENTNDVFLLSSIADSGGVAMYYESEEHWGLIGYSSSIEEASCVFELGSINSISCWNFDHTALWSGTKNDTAGAYTTDGITLGSNGIRGEKWRIDTNGDVSLMGGLIEFTSANNGGRIVGWKLNSDRFSNARAAIVSASAEAGVFLSGAIDSDFDNHASSSLANYIEDHGGAYMTTKSNGVEFAAYNSRGQKIFRLSSHGVSSISEWNIEQDALFVGSKKISAGTFTNAAGDITFSSTGIRGHKWRLEADGSGSLAGNVISWSAEGEVDFKAKVSADNITSGTIAACTIQSSAEKPAWALNRDGSGQLAGGGISWNKNGDAVFNGEVQARSGRIGDFRINQQGLYYGDVGQWSSDAQVDMAQIGPNFVRIAQQFGYGGIGNIGFQKIGIGLHADPTKNYSLDNFAMSSLYVYRKMLASTDPYFPAAKIISDNAANRNIALRVVGGLQVHGGVIESGHVMEFSNEGDARLLDLSFGTTFLLVNKSNVSRDFFFPTLSEVRNQLGITDISQSFCVPVRVICGSESFDCAISTSSSASGGPSKEEGGSIVDNNGTRDYANSPRYGANRIALARCDSWSFALTYTTRTGYYIQILNIQN